MDKLVELNREYWVRVHNMCEGTDVKPWECFRWKYKGVAHDWISPFTHPLFSDLSNDMEAQFAVAILNDDHTGKGRPVWIGDEIYDKEFLQMIRVGSLDKGSGLLFDDQGNVLRFFPKDYCWHPINGELTPKPTRTFRILGEGHINGHRSAELPCPTDTGNHDLIIVYSCNGSEIATSRFTFETEVNVRKVFYGLKRVLESAEQD